MNPAADWPNKSMMTNRRRLTALATDQEFSRPLHARALLSAAVAYLVRSAEKRS
jgi:hypothetical protein